MNAHPSAVHRYRGSWLRPTALAERLRRPECELGFTLVEVLISMTILLVIITISMTVMSTFFSNASQINGAYQGFDEVIPSTTSMQQYIITMVEPTNPAVSAGGYIPVPPFAYNPPVGTAGNNPALPAGYQLDPNSATFTSNTGDPNGPAQINVTTTANAPPKAGNPQTYTLQVTVTPADPGTCPGVTTGTQCTWGVSTKTKIVFTVSDLVNGSTNSTPPVLQYTTNISSGTIPYSTLSGSAWMEAFGPNTCLSQGNCPADQVASVTISIQIQLPGGLSTVYQTTVNPVSIPYAQNVG